MLPIRTVLFATDFSKHSEYVYPLACALARDYGARLVLVHVVMKPVVIYGEGVIPVDPDEEREVAKERLETLARATYGIEVEHRLVDGDPAREILETAKDVNAEMIVMATHGWTGLMRLLMGSVAEQVLRKASCPVLTIRTPATLTAKEHEPAVVAR
jgi:nucleotide-binding universal stress UspA family protein